MSGPLLDECGSWIAAANVRGPIDGGRTWVESGLGHAGDLVFGVVEPPAGTHVRLLDWRRRPYLLSAPCSVVAVLGPRDSSTHVCAFLPPEGLTVGIDTHAHWVAGESGIVGCLERVPSTSSAHRPEHALPFRCRGLLADSRGILNIGRFEVRPSIAHLGIPVVMVAATSSEAGKTVLAGELIRRLARQGLRVGAIKVTGTGGVRDSIHHARSGAAITLDQVDAGLITTHGDPAPLRERIPLLFRQAETSGADLIVAELGGDLISANNPVIFDLPELMERTTRVLVIANDALAAAGVKAVNDTLLHFPTDRLRFLSSPFRNHAGMARRMARVGITQVFDPRSGSDLDWLAADVCNALACQTSADLDRSGKRRFE